MSSVIFLSMCEKFFLIEYCMGDFTPTCRVFFTCKQARIWILKFKLFFCNVSLTSTFNVRFLLKCEWL
jgi:hypothetical protein